MTGLKHQDANTHRTIFTQRLMRIGASEPGPVLWDGMELSCVV